LERDAMAQRKNNSNTAHSRAVEAISNARQHVRKYRFDMERANIPDNQIFVNSENPNHPQKNAHAALMDYFEEINQIEYVRMFDDLWAEPLKDAAGNEITVTVPSNNRVRKTVDESTVGNMIPDLSKIETTEETLPMEALAHKWAGRTITVEAKVESPYRDGELQTSTVRLWMPPKVIKASYSRINDALSKVGLLAKTSAPVEHDPAPI